MCVCVCVCVHHILIHSSADGLGSFPCLGYCKLCRYGQWVLCIFFEFWFSPDIYSEGQLMDHMIGSVPSFFLELFLHWSPVAYWASTDLGSSCFSVLSFCLFILFVGFSRQEYGSGLQFPSPVDNILSDLSTMTCPSWVAPHGMA